MTTAEKIVTAEQLLSAPGLGRCELVRGELIMMSPAGARHGRIVVNITTPLDVFVRQHAVLIESDTLDDCDLLPAFSLPVAEIFGR